MACGLKGRLNSQRRRKGAAGQECNEVPGLEHDGVQGDGASLNRLRRRNNGYYERPQILEWSEEGLLEPPRNLAQPLQSTGCAGEDHSANVSGHLPRTAGTPPAPRAKCRLVGVREIGALAILLPSEGGCSLYASTACFLTKHPIGIKRSKCRVKISVFWDAHPM